MADSQIPVVIDRLTAVLDSAGVTFVDGPVPIPSTATALVAVGWDGSDDNDLSASSQQNYAGINGPSPSRDEQVEVYCCVMVTQGGGGAFKPVRDAAYAVLKQVADALRANPGSSAEVLWSEITDQDLHQAPTAAGLLALIPFTVHARCRI